jgi:hypothetical protein
MLARLSHNQGDVRCAGSWIHFHWETMWESVIRKETMNETTTNNKYGFLLLS